MSWKSAIGGIGPGVLQGVQAAKGIQDVWREREEAPLRRSALQLNIDTAKNKLAKEDIEMENLRRDEELIPLKEGFDKAGIKSPEVMSIFLNRMSPTDIIMKDGVPYAKRGIGKKVFMEAMNDPYDRLGILEGTSNHYAQQIEELNKGIASSVEGAVSLDAVREMNTNRQKLMAEKTRLDEGTKLLKAKLIKEGLISASGTIFDPATGRVLSNRPSFWDMYERAAAGDPDAQKAIAASVRDKQAVKSTSPTGSGSKSSKLITITDGAEVRTLDMKNDSDKETYINLTEEGWYKVRPRTQKDDENEMEAIKAEMLTYIVKNKGRLTKEQLADATNAYRSGNTDEFNRLTGANIGRKRKQVSKPTTGDTKIGRFIVEPE